MRWVATAAVVSVGLAVAEPNLILPLVALWLTVYAVALGR